MLTFKEFQQAKDTVEKIVQINIKSEDVSNETIKTTLKEAIEGVDKKYEHTIYNFMGSLFRNVMINRLNELGENAKQYSMTAIEMIAVLIQEERKKGEAKYV